MPVSDMHKVELLPVLPWKSIPTQEVRRTYYFHVRSSRGNKEELALIPTYRSELLLARKHFSLQVYFSYPCTKSLLMFLKILNLAKSYMGFEKKL